MKRRLKKQTIRIIEVVLGVLIIGILVYVLFIRKSQEQILTSKMEQMAGAFYSDFYYQQIGSTDQEKKEFVKKYEKLGLKVNLDNLSRYQGEDSEAILKDFVNKKTNQKCDKFKTQATIYPKEPYDKNSYKVEIQLDCGF